MLTNAPRGTKDILPQQSYKWNFVEGKFRATCERYGFSEIRTPMFEHTELFQRGVGDSSDIVRKEMYTFEDRGKRSITLKPEGTAPVVRSFIENKLYAETQPSKYCYITPCFRYEKPQSGRLREFHQFGIEIFGSKNMTADAEVISLASDFLEDLGIRELELHINSVGCPVCRSNYRKILQGYFRPHLDELCSDCKERFENNPMRIIDCKVDSCKEIAKDAPKMLEYLCDDCKAAFDDVRHNLDTAGVRYTVDPTIVRGLDYYTKTAFEFVTTEIGAQGTVCGGGRYDHLIEEVGGPETPGVGFGLGIERLLMLMESQNIEIEDTSKPAALFAFMGNAAKDFVIKTVRNFRKRGLHVEMDLNERNFKGQLKYADRIGAKYTVLIGDNELQNQKATLKIMAESKQEEVDFSLLFDRLSK